jgi:peptide/nickel transport system substrate-binding protein
VPARSIPVTFRDKGKKILPSNLHRREFLGHGLRAGAAFTVLGGAGGLLEACGGSSPGSSGPTTTIAKKKAEAIGVGKGKPKLGGSVTMGTEAEETGMDPTYAHFDATGVCYARAVYDPLAIVLSDGSVVPYLAESIVPNKTYTKWMITLRPNLVFHDGTPCDGAALAYCMEAFKASLLVNFALGYWKKGGIKQVGPRSVSIEMTDPWVPFPAWLAGYIGGQVAYLFSPTQYKKGESTLDQHPVGTGPFVFQEWVPNDHFTLTRNPHYWRKDANGTQLPYLDSWTFKPIVDVTSRLEALQSGTIDLMHTDDDPTILSIDGDSSLTSLRDDELLVGEPDMSFDMVFIPSPVLKDIRLRQALASSFNQAEYIKVVGRNIVTPATGPFPTPSPYNAPTGYPSFDLNKAKSLVASWMKDHGGKAPSITYSTTNSTTAATNAAVVQQFYQAAGFQVQVKQVQQAELINDALAGGYDVFSWRQFANIDPDLNYVFWTSAAGPVNFARNYDPYIDHQMNVARQSADPSVRKTAYENVASQFAKDLPYIWSARDVWCIAANAKTQNWNNPTDPQGRRGLSMLGGIVWPTEIWTT